MDYISLLYRMRTGSVRLMFIPDSNGTGLSEFTLIPYNNTTTTSIFTNVNPDYFPQARSGRPVNWFANYAENFLELEIPFYQNYPAMPTGVGKMTVATEDPTSAPLDINKVPYNYGTQLIIPRQQGTFNVYRSIGEDFSFGYLLGPPMRTRTLA